MESSAGCSGVGVGVDCGVGTIVWVRRRNGSWWPGRILGSDELSASHLMSPRSGTPVKLLGREDASVDWYNLEKSKRVKAFRCGEFDACIERAEASQGAPIKKREKYARREDAILHALELEKKQLESPQQKPGTTYFVSNKTCVRHKNEAPNFYSPEPHVRLDEHGGHRTLPSHKPQNILTKSDCSHGEENLVGSYANKRRINKQFRWQDDNSEVIPRMRGLQDFGLRTVQSKRKPSENVNWQNSSKPLDNHVEMLSGSGCILEDAVHISSSKNSMQVKKKRSQNRMVEETLIKKRDRRRPLIQVLQSSAKLAPHLLQCSDNDTGISMPEEKEHMQAICRAKRSKCFYFSHDIDSHLDHVELDSEHQSVQENQIGARRFIDNPIDVGEGYVCSGLIEANDLDCSEENYLEHGMGEVATMLTDSAYVLVPGSKDCEHPEFQVPDRFARMNDCKISESENISQLHEQITMLHERITDASAEAGVSQWHMKGKRNSRNLGKRPMDAVDGKLYPFENGSGPIWGMHPNKDSFYTCDEGDLIDRDLAHDQVNAYTDWRNSGPLETKDGGRRSHSSHNDSDSAFWEEPIEPFDPVYDLQPLLVDVELKVETSYQGEHVPLVSLMSRLNGKAIIGHPIQVELLESGSTSHLISKLDFVTDETSTPQPVWRTARRTVMQRVPRLNPVTSALEEEDPEALRYSGLKKCGSHAFQSRSRKFQKKNSKRLSLSSQKTRTLSSLATNYKLDGGSCGVKPASSTDILDGLIQPEGSAPLVACVPVKVVFSRLLEAVGKPPSAIVNRVRLNGSEVRDPS